jgi:hypothetical protein
MIKNTFLAIASVLLLLTTLNSCVKDDACYVCTEKIEIYRTVPAQVKIVDSVTIIPDLYCDSDYDAIKSIDQEEIFQFDPILNQTVKWVKSYDCKKQ